MIVRKPRTHRRCRRGDELWSDQDRCPQPLRPLGEVQPTVRIEQIRGNSAVYAGRSALPNGCWPRLVCGFTAIALSESVSRRMRKRAGAGAPALFAVPGDRRRLRISSYFLPRATPSPSRLAESSPRDQPPSGTPLTPPPPATQRISWSLASKAAESPEPCCK